MSMGGNVTYMNKVIDSLSIRPARINDIIRLNKLFIQSIDTDFTYFSDSFKKKLASQHSIPRLAKAYLSPFAQLILAWDGHELVGYCLLRSEPKSLSYLHWMYVRPDQRGRKLGESLLQAAIETAESHHAHALQLVTHDKEEFYARYHFTPLRRIPGLIGGADMTVMELKLG